MLQTTSKLFASALLPTSRHRLSTVAAAAVSSSSSSSHRPLPTVFTVGEDNGFLPAGGNPMLVLPDKWGAVNDALDRMPVTKEDGTPGLLSHYEFGDFIDKHFESPSDLSDITGPDPDPHLLTALFRDYTFLASCYLLEPCHHNWQKSGKYGLGREVLPASLAKPLVAVSEALGAKPFMEYSQSYCVYNWKQRVPGDDFHTDNLDIIRKQHGCASERGFIVVHVAMVAESRHMVRHAREILEATQADDRELFNSAMDGIVAAYGRAHDTFTTMWKKSKPEDYNEFRTFIMGTKNQPMFPNGVMYEGVGDDEPRYARGESGANDNMIPLADNLLELTASFPDNPLTAALREFRSYRPVAHQEYLLDVQQRATDVGVAAYAAADAGSLVRYLALMDKVRAWRQTHWDMVKGYILKFSSHPRATGGTPITTWLPNNLRIVLRHLDEGLTSVPTATGASALDPEMEATYKQLLANSDQAETRLVQEMEMLSRKFGQDMETPA